MKTIPLDGRMRLLVSVRNADEARAALDGGADIIDIKEPSRGPLGMADIRVMEEVVAAVGGRQPVSTALGELRDNPDPTALPSGIAFAKIGLHDAPGSWREKLAATFTQIPHIKPVAVAYAVIDALEEQHIRRDQISDVIRWAIDHHATGVLIDTHLKDGRNLFDTPTGERAAEYIRRCRTAGLWIALAGSLSGASLERAASFGPDIIAVRGAACTGNDRNAQVDARRVASLRDLIAKYTAQPAMSAD
ncbi:MAG: (5-formylfuran-3-yl)methyl phosphate synthase [Planctomycetes bacterium]|nr:(5-formylfuran-3-yl)methyl phosphate synthase [Planctomycetota bacterium]